MTTTATSPHGAELMTVVMKRAAALVKQHDIRDESDPEHKYFQVTPSNWATVLEHYGEPIPPVILRYDPESHLPFIRQPDGSITGPRDGAVERVKVQSLAVPNKDDDGATITCTGPCGERKPVKKFPTLKAGKGRGSVCRDCEKAGRDERMGRA